MDDSTPTRDATENSAASLTALASDSDFLALRRRKNRVALLLTLAMFAVYYGFVALMAFGKDLLGTKISGATTVGIPIGIGVILVACVLTGIYASWANKSYDAEVAKLKARHGLR